MGVAVWAICQDQCEYHTIQKAEIPVWDILPWSMQVKVETSDWDMRLLGLGTVQPTKKKATRQDFAIGQRVAIEEDDGAQPEDDGPH